MLRFDHEVVRAHRRRNIIAGQARRTRRAPPKAGDSRYLVEPNVKDGKGGLRDLQTLFWIGKYFYRVAHRRGTGREGRLHRGRVPRVPEGRGLPVGGALPHALPHRQGRGAAASSTSSARSPSGSATPAIPACRRVERFMKHYFLVAKDVGDLTRIFCAALEEEQAKHVPGFNRIFLGLPAPQAQARRHVRLRRRQPPHQHRRRPGVRARSGQPAPAVLVRRQARAGIPPRRPASCSPARSA